MLDELVGKALNGGYGELISGVILVLLSLVGYYIHRQIKKYDKAYDAIFDEKGLNSSVNIHEQRLDSHDKQIEQVVDSHKALVSDVIKIRGDTKFIRGWIEGQSKPEKQKG